MNNTQSAAKYETQPRWLVDTYNAIVHFKLQHGYPPTLREIGDLIGVKSTSTVSHRLGVLRARGFITFDTGKARTIRLTEKSPVPPRLVNS